MGVLGNDTQGQQQQCAAHQAYTLSVTQGTGLPAQQAVQLVNVFNLQIGFYIINASYSVSSMTEQGLSVKEFTLQNLAEILFQ